MSGYQYDLFIIGAGSGGVRAARIAAGLGARVAMAEDRYLGGTCVNVGCVPKKLFVYASHFAEDFSTAKHFGWLLDQPDFCWKTLLENKNNEINRLKGVYKNLLDDAGVETIIGRATLLDRHTVEVNGKTISSERILVATGGWPNIPTIPGKEYSLSSNEVFFMDKLPEKIIIVGGGYIAVEFASIFNNLGLDTTLIYRGSLFLRGFDHDLRQQLAIEMQQKGIMLKFETDITHIEKQGDELIATLDNGEQLSTGKIMYATGRNPNTSHLGLEKAGVRLDDKKAIIVDKDYQTNIPSIYAIGDVTNRMNLTPVALAEAMALANHLYGDQAIKMNYDTIPTCLFSQPNLGTVGLSEEEARKQYKDIDIYKSSFKPMKLSLSEAKEKTLMKLIVDKETDRVIGAHMLGSEAGEIIQGIGIAIKAGATKQDFDSTIGVHPTAAEEFVAMREAVK